MNRRLTLLIALLAATTLIVGSGGFSAASADRGLSVAVAQNEDASLSLWDPGARTTGGPPPAWARYNRLVGASTGEDPERVRLVAVRNAFPGATLTVDARLAHSVTGVTVTDVDRAILTPGEATALSATVQCPPAATRRLPLTVNATSESIETSVRFDVVVTCPSPGSASGPTQGPPEAE
jgi:hypothetical protein